MFLHSKSTCSKQMHQQTPMQVEDIYNGTSMDDWEDKFVLLNTHKLLMLIYQEKLAFSPEKPTSLYTHPE